MNSSRNVPDQREGPDDRRSGWSLRLPRIRFIRPLVYLAVGAVVVFSVLGWYRNWRLGADIVERDKVIAVMEAREDSASAVLDSVMVVKTADSTVAAATERQLAVVGVRLDKALRTLSRRPVRVVRVPGEPPVIVIDGVPANPEEIATTIDRCNTLAAECADFRAKARLDSIADAAHVATLEGVIVKHEEKDVLQAQTDSTKDKQIVALKKRTSGHPFTFTVGPSMLYRMDPCGGSTSSDPVEVEETGVTISVQTSTPCTRLVYGLGITGGLDLVWFIGKVGNILRIF